MSTSRLFEPVKVGAITLKQRVAMAPLTRFRADDAHVPLPIVTEYYAQRASVPGTLIITEGTFVGRQYGGYAHVPGIYTDDQIAAWKNITDAVHKKGSYIFMQLWALGRTADPAQAEKEGIVIKTSSAVPMSENAPTPLEYTQEDINVAVQAYATAAKNAIAAGFDGVEIHGANGYLIDQFIQDTVNQRTDKYGGSVENRSRFAVEIAKAVVAAVGADRTGIRLSPFSSFQGMGMADPYLQFGDLIRQLDALDLAYVHLVTSRISGSSDVEEGLSLGPLVKEFRGTIFAAGGFKLDSAKQIVDEEFKDRDVVVVFGRYFISTPDLVFRLKEGIEFNPYNRATFYNAGEMAGYVDQPFSKEYLALQAQAA